jgi:hypothetical protein
MNEDDHDQNRVFDTALRNRRDVSGTFFGEFGFDAARSASMIDSDAVLRRRVRSAMETGANGGRLFLLEEEAAPYRDRARRLLDDGRVGAVDGTNALAKVDFMNTTQYACAVNWVTSRARGAPHITITETSSSYTDPAAIADADAASIVDICEQFDRAHKAESWPTTFREYEERLVAMSACPAEVVLIDGPLITQNMVTQSSGRALLDEMFARLDRQYIGVIKELSNSWATCVWSAASLRTGEGYVVCPVGKPIEERYEFITQWVRSERVSDFVRVVYRPAQKAFAFECRRQLVGLACAILLEDASPTINHELPMLLETVDAQLRAGFDADAAKDAILGRLMAQDGGFRSAIDAISERDFR